MALPRIRRKRVFLSFRWFGASLINCHSGLELLNLKFGKKRALICTSTPLNHALLVIIC